MLRRCLALALALVGAFGCVDTEDEPSNVHDLRVLGVQLEPPEIVAPPCPDGRLRPEQLQSFSAALQYAALIADPRGADRPLHYQVFACDGPAGEACDEGYLQIPMAEGDVAPEPGKGFVELRLPLSPGSLAAPEGGPLLQRVLDNDTYKGLAGIRLTLLLRLTAGDEQIRAEKLMVYSCRFPQPAPNANPILPGITLNGAAWGADDVPVVTPSRRPFILGVPDYSDREERYQAPRTDGSPVTLTESWQLAWHTEAGTMKPERTGGTDAFSGVEGKASSEWEPDGNLNRDVRFYVVVRDGRGGLSWLIRSLHYGPEPGG